MKPNKEFLFSMAVQLQLISKICSWVVAAGPKSLIKPKEREVAILIDLQGLLLKVVLQLTSLSIHPAQWNSSSWGSLQALCESLSTAIQRARAVKMKFPREPPGQFAVDWDREYPGELIIQVARELYWESEPTDLSALLKRLLDSRRAQKLQSVSKGACCMIQKKIFCAPHGSSFYWHQELLRTYLFLDFTFFLSIGKQSNCGIGCGAKKDEKLWEQKAECCVSLWRTPSAWHGRKC